MKEIRSQKIIIRYVPKSLIQLAKFSKVSFPMTEKRVKHMKEMFFAMSEVFCYSFRHLHASNFCKAAHKVFGDSYFYSYKPQDFFALNDQLID